MQGVVKVYDPATGVGIVVSDGRDEIVLQPGSLDDSIFRTLRQGQRIVFDVDETEGASVAVRVRIGSDGY